MDEKQVERVREHFQDRVHDHCAAKGDVLDLCVEVERRDYETWHLRRVAAMSERAAHDLAERSRALEEFVWNLKVRAFRGEERFIGMDEMRHLLEQI